METQRKQQDGSGFLSIETKSFDKERQPLLETNPPQQQSVSNIRNVIQLGISFCILFVAFNTVQSFESSVNHNIGLESLSVLYGCFAVSNIPAGAIVGYFTERWSLLFGGLTYVSYIAAHLYPTRATLLPTAALLGFGAAILWTAQGAYLAKNSDDTTRGKHSGVFFACFMANVAIGNLGAALALEHGFQMHRLFWVLFGVALAGTASFIILPAPPKAINTNIDDPTKKGVSVSEIINMFREPAMLLLIPALVYWGLSQSFFFSKITQLIPKTKLGFVMTAFGVTDTLGSVLMGRLSDKFGRGLVLGLATVVGVAGYILSWWVVPHHDHNQPLWMFFLVMSLLGLSDAGFNTQIYATMGSLQPNKAESGGAFLKLFQSSCTAIAFGYSQFLSLRYIILIVCPALVIGYAFFLLMELYLSKKARVTVIQ